MAQMNKETLIDACRKNGGYSQPHLNDQLYLQYKGFTKIENLEPYVDLKVLWLEQNGIEIIEGLSTQTKLVSLFLQNNIIRRIQGLNHLANLRILNLSHNVISKLENLRCCPHLETLTASHCRIENLSDMEEIHYLKELSTLDVSHNHLSSFNGESGASRDNSPQGEDSPLVKFFQKMPTITVLYLHGNEVIRTLKDYRRNMVAHLPELSYLDERPVFPDERRTTMAWLRGGVNAESAERDAIREEKKKEMTDAVQHMIDLKEKNKEKRAQREKEWEELQAAKAQWEKDQQLEEIRLTTELDHEEFGARATIEAEEDNEWTPLSSSIAGDLVSLTRSAKQAAAEAKAKAAAEKEIAEREAAIAAQAKQERLSKEQERELWLKKFAEEDEMFETDLQDDLNKFLDHLNPGTVVSADSSELLAMPKKSTPDRAVGACTPPEASESNQEKLMLEIKARTQTAAAAASAAQKKARKNDVWEKYYAFEKTAAKRFQ